MARTKNRFNAVNLQEEKINSESKCWKTALYARLSVELLNRKTESIENQLELMRKYTSAKSEFSEIYEYTDHGFTGTDFNRPGFERMMDDARRGKINCIVVKDLSRLGRNYLETSNLIETIFPFLGVRFISVNDHFDTNEENNGNKELEIALKNLVNDMYARDVSKRVSTVRKQDQLRGKFMGSNAPYGYKVDEDHPLRQLIVDEAAAEIVREIYEMVLSGTTLRQISIRLQEQKLNIPGQYFRTGHLYREPEDKITKWYIGTISNILHNQTYIGNLVQGKRKTRHYKGESRHFTEEEEWIVIEGAHEAIISKAVFDEVQKVLSRKVEISSFSSERTKDIPVKPNRYQGILYCGVCGEKLQYSSTVTKGNDAERKYYFACEKKYDLQINAHTGIHITELTLEKILKDLIGELLQRFDFKSGVLTRKMEQALKEGSKEWMKDIHKIEYKLSDLDAVSSSRYEEYVLGIIGKEEFLNNKSYTEEQRAALELQLQQLQEKRSVYETAIHNKLQWLLGLNEASKGDLDRELIQLLITRIDLYPRHELQIHWRFSEEDIFREDGE